VLGTPIGDQLAALGWRPQTVLSPYGPLWTAYETLVVRATHDVMTGILLLKVVPLAANLVSALLTWRILGFVRPGLRLVGTVAFLWNPAVIVEVAAEGHVEGLMTCLALLGIYGALRLQPTRALLSGSLAVVTKYIPAVLLPGQLVYLWRRSGHRGRIPRSLALGAAAGIGIGLVAFAPFWAGLRTFDGLREMGQPGPWPTVTGRSPPSSWAAPSPPISFAPPSASEIRPASSRRRRARALHSCSSRPRCSFRGTWSCRSP
jgi:hypothetical protein